MEKYTNWIEETIATQFGGDERKTYGKCHELAEAMKAAFPELTITRGHVECPPPWNRRSHWWLVDPEGNIVDPAAGQFPHIYEYDPYKEGDDVLIGKCMDCGTQIWGLPDTERYFCNQNCEDSYRQYLKTGEL